MKLSDAIWYYGGTVLACLICGWSLARGGSTERSGAAIILIGWCLSILLQDRGKGTPGQWVFYIDVAAALAFIGLSLSSRKIWTLFLAACQLVAVGSHFAARLDGLLGFTYFTGVGIWGGLALIFCLLVGQILFELEKARGRSTV